jgi:hypothetical protein
MISHPDVEALIGRHRRFWTRGEGSFLRSTGVFLPSLPIGLPQPDGSVITHTEELTADMFHPDAWIDEVERRLDMGPEQLIVDGKHFVAPGIGDQLPHSQPPAKIPWIEAMLGCPITMTEGHIWNGHYAGDPAELVERGVHLDGNPWFELYLEFLRRLQARLGERFPVTANTLFRGPSDLAAAVMGVQEACVGWLDDPAGMARLMRHCTDTLLTVVEAGRKALKPYRDGYVSAWSIWAPAPVVRMQADHSTLLSARMYEKQILPFDLEVVCSCPLSLFHIHNCGLHIAPILVQIPELDAIEVAVDPYPTPERKPYEIEMLQLILAHKALILDLSLPSREEGEWVLEQLPRQGLFFNSWYEPPIWETLPDDLAGSELWLLE